MLKHKVIMLVSNYMLSQWSFLSWLLVSVAVEQSSEYFLHNAASLIRVHVSDSFSEGKSVYSTSCI